MTNEEQHFKESQSNPNDNPSPSDIFGLADGWVDYISILIIGPFGLVYGLFDRHLGAFVFGVATTLMYVGFMGLFFLGIDAITPFVVDVYNWVRPVVFGFGGMVRRSLDDVGILVLVFVVGLTVALGVLWIAVPEWNSDE